MKPAKRPFAWSAFTRRKRLHSIGVSVTDTTPEIRIAAVIVTANSLKSRPRMPLMNRMGMNTAASDTVIETIVKPISFDPASDASSGDSPRSMCRTMFSSMTIASSTTKPIDRMSAIIERLSRVNPMHLHHRERAQDGKRQRERGNERGGSVVQEEEDHRDHEHERGDHRHLDVA